MIARNRAAFFDAVRAGLFGGRLTPSQVKGCNAILESCRRHGVTDPRHVANILAQVRHETGGYMLPIKETVFAGHKDKNPSDETVIARLNRAFANGQLPWVKTPYWRDGAFGRGMIQITHWGNYKKLGARLGVDLVGNPDLALDTRISADIAVVGMAEGAFTGRKLADYFNATTDDPVNARRIVNGPDGTDKDVAGYHRAFLAALEAAEIPGPPDLERIPDPKRDMRRLPPEDGGSGLSIAAGLLIALALIGAAAAKFAGLI